MADLNALSLEAGGKLYRGWKSAVIDQGIDQISGGYQLEIIDRWNGQSVSWPIVPGDQCVLRIGDDTVITGAVDTTAIEFDARRHTVSVTGRDRTGDLVDCAAVHSPDQWSLPLEQIARILAAPFGIKVGADLATGDAFVDFKLQQGECAFAAIDRMCKMRGVLPVSDSLGGLRITRAGTSTTSTALIEGKNILGAKGEFSWSQRFSKVIVKGQSGGAGVSDDATAAAVRAESSDRAINRYRPTMVIAEGNLNGSGAKARAEWEIAVAAGKGTKVTITVPGWRQDNGQLWPINALVPVQSPTLGIDDVLLITHLRRSLGERGTITELSLTRPDAYRALAILPKSKKGATGLPPGTEMFAGKS